MMEVLPDDATGTGDMGNGQECAGLLDAGMAADVTGRRGPHSRRRWSCFRVSVRGLLLLVLVIGCGLGWIAQVVRTGQVQRRAVAAIYQAGGWVAVRHRVGPTPGDVEPGSRDGRGGWSIASESTTSATSSSSTCTIAGPTPSSPMSARLTHLRQLHRPGPGSPTPELAHLGRLSNLQLLSLDDTQVTDAGLTHLKGLKRPQMAQAGQDQGHEGWCGSTSEGPAAIEGDPLGLGRHVSHSRGNERVVNATPIGPFPDTPARGPVDLATLGPGRLVWTSFPNPPRTWLNDEPRRRGGRRCWTAWDCL